MATRIDASRTDRPSLAYLIAERLFDYRPDSAAIAKAKLCVADYLACALSSTDLPWSRQAIALARESEGTCLIVGTPHASEADEAAFANAVLGHGLVRDDMHLGSVSHLGVVAIPTALALASERTVSGRDFLTAIAAAYEAGGTLGRLIIDVEISKIFRPTGITGPFAAAAAAAKLIDLDCARFANALSLAANTAAGYNEWAATGGTGMFFHPGFAARNGLTAARLAAAGAHVSPSALEGPAGMLAAFGKRPPGRIDSPFSDQAQILSVFFKEVPACNFAQTPAQVARDIALEERLDIAGIERVTVRVSHAAAHYPGCNSSGPFDHILQTKMSIQYNVASALIHGHFDEKNYVPGSQPETLRLAQRIDIVVDDEITAQYPGQQAASILIRRHSGHDIEASAGDVGPAGNELVFERLHRAASTRLGDSATSRLIDCIKELDSLTNAESLLALCGQTA